MNNKEDVKIIIERNLAELLHKLSLVFNRITVEKNDDESFWVNISSEEEANLIIGKNGDNMNSLQRVLKLIVQREIGEKMSLTLDADNYRQRRKDGAINNAKIKARKCLETGRTQELEPMPAYVRRAVHLFLKENSTFETLITNSVGDGDLRHIQISLQDDSKPVASPKKEKKEPKSKKEQFEELEKIDELMDF